MNLEQAKELEVNRWMLLFDEASIAGVNLNLPHYKHFLNAVSAWGESLVDVRMHQSAQERMTAAAEATQRYVTEKRN